MKINKNLIRVVILLVFVSSFVILGIIIMTNSTVTVLAQTNATPQSTPQTEHEKILAELTKSIAGKEKKPAGEVWKNIQQFKELPADRFLRLMNTYTRVLGVSCSHCHIVGQWEKEDLQTKQIAREMMDMMDKINIGELAKVKNLKGKPPLVSCYTCHRGQPTPETRLAPSPTPQKVENINKPTLMFLGVYHFEDEREDINSAKRQKEIADLVNKLKEFKPTKIAVEALPNDTKYLRKKLEIVNQMRRAGVKFLAGSDAPNPYSIPGFGLHEELKLLVEAGFTPMEALKTATLNPAEY